ENLMARAAGVVAMGGYNTFCEILSFDKPGLIVPRTAPRLEQYIRAQRAAELGLVAILPDDDRHDPRTMAAALLQLAQPRRPSARLCCRPSRLARRPAARSDPEPHPTLRPGHGSGGGGGSGDRPSARAFPAHAGLGGALRRDHSRPALVGVGARQGHLDHA